MDKVQDLKENGLSGVGRRWNHRQCFIHVAVGSEDAAVLGVGSSDGHTTLRANVRLVRHAHSRTLYTRLVTT